MKNLDTKNELPVGWMIHKQPGARCFTNHLGRPSRSWEFVVVDERRYIVTVMEKKADAIADALVVVAERRATA